MKHDDFEDCSTHGRVDMGGCKHLAEAGRFDIEVGVGYRYDEPKSGEVILVDVYNGSGGHGFRLTSNRARALAALLNAAIEELENN